MAGRNGLGHERMYPMQGQFLGDDIEIAIDATVAGAQPSDGEVYFIAVKKAAIGKTVGNGTVEAISLDDYRGETPVEHKCISSSFPTAVNPGITGFWVRPSDNRTDRYKLSASSYKYLENGTLSPRTFIVRTATGKAVKMSFGNLSSDGRTLNIRYK